jgi:RNA polymerase-binding transcription factor DksA
VDGPDLDAIERDLADVERALQRLEDGSYWTDEVTGAPIPDDELVRHPTTRRSPSA